MWRHRYNLQPYSACRWGIRGSQLLMTTSVFHFICWWRWALLKPNLILNKIYMRKNINTWRLLFHKMCYQGSEDQLIKICEQNLSINNKNNFTCWQMKVYKKARLKKIFLNTNHKSLIFYYKFHDHMKVKVMAQ